MVHKEMKSNYARLARQRAKRKSIVTATAKAAQTAANRQCGECTLCCTVLGVDELGKPPGQPCSKLLQINAPNSSCGCSIYGHHPESCRVYACLWRTGGIEDEDYRPDKVGVIFDQVMRLALDGEGPSIATRYKAINVREAFEGAADTGKAQQAVRILGQWHPLIIIGPDGKTRALNGPDHILNAMLKEANINPNDLIGGKAVLVD